MPATKVACPNCSGELPVSAITVGKRLRCPRCATSFTVTSETGATAAVGASAAATVGAASATETHPDKQWLPTEPDITPPPVRKPQPISPRPRSASKPEPETAQEQQRPKTAPELPAELPAEQPARSGKRALLLVLLCGGALLLLGTVALVVALNRKDPAKSQTVVQGQQGKEPGTSSPNSDRTPGEPREPAPPIEVNRGANRYDPPGTSPIPGRGDPGDNGQAPPIPAEMRDGPRSTLSPEEQDKVNLAIDKGVAWLKKGQTGTGAWAGGGHTVGYTAMPALTMLECGVKPDDPTIQKAATLVRNAVPKLAGTYELGLSILFLDRLGDPKDRPLIQTMGLRLVAGQTATGGWSYHCPILSGPDERTLLTALEQTRPRTAFDLVVMGQDGKLMGLVKGVDPNKVPEFVVPGSDPKTPGVVSPNDKPPPIPAQGTLPFDPSNPQGTLPMGIGANPQGTVPFGGNPGDPRNPNGFKPVPLAKVQEGLPNNLKRVPALLPPTKDNAFPTRDGTDNSNTQFATLGLWAAGRHQIPTERSLALLTMRFRTSQASNGGWVYHYIAGGGAGSTPAMT